jgi:hypothetical protein
VEQALLYTVSVDGETLHYKDYVYTQPLRQVPELLTVQMLHNGMLRYVTVCYCCMRYVRMLGSDTESRRF